MVAKMMPSKMMATISTKVQTKQWLMILVSGALSASCAHEAAKVEPAAPAPAGIPMSAEEEAAIKEIRDEVTVGKAIAGKLLGTFGEYDQDKELLKYVHLVGLTVASQAGRPELKFRFGILDTDDVNAFAAPGGYVFVTKGLLKNLQNEEELAGVLAHEIAHVNLRHMYKEIQPKREVTTGETLARLLSRGGSDIGGSMAAMVSKGMKMLIDEGLGHDKEYEADSTAMVYTAAVGYDPIPYGRLLQRLQKAKGVEKVGKTHPGFDRRLAGLKKTLQENGLSGTSTSNKEVLAKRFASTFASLKKE